MKHFCIFASLFFLLGVCSVNAQDSQSHFENDNIDSSPDYNNFPAKLSSVITISDRYSVESVTGRVHFLHQFVDNYWIRVTEGNNFHKSTSIRIASRSSIVLSDGIYVITIPAGMGGRIDSIIEKNIDALNIIDYDYFKAEEAKARAEKIAEKDRAKNQKTTESNSDKLIVGINANAGGLIPLGNTLKQNGPSFNIEFIKNSFYSNISFSIPIQDNIGFGFSSIFNYLWKSKIGDFYLGGGLGYTYHTNHFFTFGANVGYRFVTSFGMYFSAGGYIGGRMNDNIELDIRPLLGMGYSF